VSASAVSLGALQGIEAAFSLGRHQPTTERMKMQAERGKRNRHSMAGLRRELLKSATIPHLSAAVVEVAAGGAVGRRRPPAGLAAGQPRLPLLRARQPGRPVRCEAAWQVPLTAGRRAPVTKQSCNSHTAASPEPTPTACLQCVVLWPMPEVSAELKHAPAQMQRGAALIFPHIGCVWHEQRKLSENSTHGGSSGRRTPSMKGSAHSSAASCFSSCTKLPLPAKGHSSSSSPKEQGFGAHGGFLSGRLGSDWNRHCARARHVMPGVGAG